MSILIISNKGQYCDTTGVKTNNKYNSDTH